MLSEEKAGDCAYCYLLLCQKRLLLTDNTLLPDQSFFEYLKSLSPSLTDLELRSLSTLPHLSTFLHSLSSRLRSHKDFEAVETLLACFLRIHGDVIVANGEELRAPLEEVDRRQKEETERVRELTAFSLGTLAFLRGTPIA